MSVEPNVANLSLDAELVEQARRLDIDVQAVAERALFHKIREKRTEAEREEMARKFHKDNAEAFAYSNEYVQRNGLPLARYRQF